MKNTEDEMFVGSGNIYEDIDFPHPQESLVKAELIRLIGILVKKRKLTQQQIGKILGLPQPKVSLLLRGRTSGFSIERLIRFLNILNYDVEIRVRPRKQKIRSLSKTT